MKKLKHWILDEDGIPKEVSLEGWAEWFESSPDRRIAYYERDGYWISTVFLGIDQDWSDKGPPLLFETMVFNDVREEREFPPGHKYVTNGESMEQERYSTKDDALIGHERHVKALDRKLDYAQAVAATISSE